MARQSKRKRTAKARPRPRAASASKGARAKQRPAPALPEELVVETAEETVAAELVPVEPRAGRRVVEAVGPDEMPLGSTPEPDAPLAGGDVDADEERAADVGDEAVGGSVATPDKDVVDDLGRAVGVELPPTAPVIPSEEILRERDARYWDLEWRARKREEGP